MKMMGLAQSAEDALTMVPRMCAYGVPNWDVHTEYIGWVRTEYHVKHIRQSLLGCHSGRSHERAVVWNWAKLAERGASSQKSIHHWHRNLH